MWLKRKNASMTHSFESAKDLYRVQYFGFLDSVINHIGQRFEQRGTVMYLKMGEPVDSSP